MALFEPVFRALNDTGARYVVVGGLATVLHGYARFTADADLVVDLAPTPAKHIIDALTALGFVPRALAGCYVGRGTRCWTRHSLPRRHSGAPGSRTRSPTAPAP